MARRAAPVLQASSASIGLSKTGGSNGRDGRASRTAGGTNAIGATAGLILGMSTRDVRAAEPAHARSGHASSPPFTLPPGSTLEPTRQPHIDAYDLLDKRVTEALAVGRSKHRDRSAAAAARSSLAKNGAQLLGPQAAAEGPADEPADTGKPIAGRRSHASTMSSAVTHPSVATELGEPQRDFGPPSGGGASAASADSSTFSGAYSSTTRAYNLASGPLAANNAGGGSARRLHGGFGDQFTRPSALQDELHSGSGGFSQKPQFSSELQTGLAARAREMVDNFTSKTQGSSSLSTASVNLTSTATSAPLDYTASVSMVTSTQRLVTRNQQEGAASMPTPLTVLASPQDTVNNASIASQQLENSGAHVTSSRHKPGDASQQTGLGHSNMTQSESPQQKGQHVGEPTSASRVGASAYLGGSAKPVSPKAPDTAGGASSSSKQFQQQQQQQLLQQQRTGNAASIVEKSPYARPVAGLVPRPGAAATRSPTQSSASLSGSSPAPLGVRAPPASSSQSQLPQSPSLSSLRISEPQSPSVLSGDRPTLEPHTIPSLSTKGTSSLARAGEKSPVRSKSSNALTPGKAGGDLTEQQQPSPSPFNGSEDVLDWPHRPVMSVPCVSAVGGVSWRGRNPGGTKINQDALVVAEHGPSQSLLVAVFDGHGAAGRVVSQFFKDAYPAALFSDARFLALLQSRTMLSSEPAFDGAAAAAALSSPRLVGRDFAEDALSEHTSRLSRSRASSGRRSAGRDSGGRMSEASITDGLQHGASRSTTTSQTERLSEGDSGLTVCRLMAQILLQVEAALISSGAVDLSLSGSTGVMVLLHKAIAYSINTGDSRANVITSAVPLTIVQEAHLAAASCAATPTGDITPGVLPGGMLLQELQAAEQAAAARQRGEPSAGAARRSPGSNGRQGAGSTQRRSPFGRSLLPAEVTPTTITGAHHFRGPGHPVVAVDGVDATSLTLDHKPDDKGERARIHAHGGRIATTAIAGSSHLIGPSRVWLRGAQVPGLNMSRSLCDLIAKQAGVISAPFMSVCRLSQADRALVLGSDGLWDFVDAAEVGSVCLSSSNTWDGAAKLARLARSRWLQRAAGADDTTVLIVRLQSWKNVV